MATQETTTIPELTTDVTINGIKYQAGKNVIVPKESADDIIRINKDFQQYERDLMVKRTSNVDAGSFAVGGSE
jgi:hypothetical protein